jgi:hypothetical protein
MTPKVIYDTKKVVEITNVHRNTSQELIEVTVDKLRLVLVQQKDRIEQKKTWHTPLGITLTILLIFPTTQFKDAFTISASTWQAVFMISFVLSFVSVT